MGQMPLQDFYFLDPLRKLHGARGPPSDQTPVSCFRFLGTSSVLTLGSS
jgi:hypothetical protein